MLEVTEPVETERLVLRPFRPADLDALAAIQSRPDVARYLLWASRGRDEVRASLAEKVGSWRLTTPGQALSLAVCLRAGGALVGDLTLFWRSGEHRQGEVGFVLHPDHTGRGYATEAAEAVLRLAFEELGLRRVTGRCDARNTASARVLERLGMRREAHFVESEHVKGEWTDELVFALLEREWRARHP